MYYLSIDLGTINFAYCLLNSEKDINEWNNSQVSNNSKDSYEIIGNKLSNKLIELGNLILQKIANEKIDIIIELQPSKNKKTLIMCGQVQMFFTLNPTNLNINSIKFYHAKNKIKYCENELNNNLCLDHLKKGYYKNKRIVVESCKIILNNKNVSPNLQKFFLESKKKDDLADCYIQGISYITSMTKADTKNTKTDSKTEIKKPKKESKPKTKPETKSEKKPETKSEVPKKKTKK